MKILVTGGAGFIGSHTCLKLLERGYDLVVVDSYVNSNRQSINRVREILKIKNNKNINIKTEEIDVRDEKALDKLFQD